LPFLCQLTFMANGHNHGELVQVSKANFMVHDFLKE
jgi:hypothetical protein